MLAVVDAALDLINEVLGPRADAKRLEEARRQFGDNELVVVRLGRQRMLLPQSTVSVLEETGMWEQLEAGAERGEQFENVFDRRE